MGPILLPIAFGLAGLLVGWVYFRIMRYSVTQFTERKAGVIQFAGLVLLRAALLAGGACGAAAVGLGSLVAYLIAFFAARTVVVARARHESVPPPKEREEAHD